MLKLNTCGTWDLKNKYLENPCNFILLVGAKKCKIDPLILKIAFFFVNIFI